MNPPFDLDAKFRRFRASIGDDRGDEHRLHASDIGSCDYATYLRINGEPRLPLEDDTIDTFFMGHAVEHYIADAVRMLVEDGYAVTHGREIELANIVGHIDFDVERDGECVAVIDVTTTKAKEPEPKRPHVLKSAFYAVERGAPMFAEWVFCLGFGKVTKQKLTWFRTADFADEVLARMSVLANIAEGDVPAMEPPPGETWRCEKGYCEAAACPRNVRATMEIPA